jgi:hypothetical protein
LLAGWLAVGCSDLMAVGYSDLMQKQPTTPEIFVMTFSHMCNQKASQTVFSSSSSSSSSCVSGVFFFFSTLHYSSLTL